MFVVLEKKEDNKKRSLGLISTFGNSGVKV